MRGILAVEFNGWPDCIVDLAEFTEALRAKSTKNKASQKRYRERVKAKKESIEDQVAVLSRRVAELEATQSSLEDRNRHLERLSELAHEKECQTRDSIGQVFTFLHFTNQISAYYRLSHVFYKL